MAIKVTCPKCLQTIKAPDSFAGKQGICPACREPVKIPIAVSPEPQAVAERLTIDRPDLQRAEDESPMEVTITRIDLTFSNFIALVFMFWIASALLTFGLFVALAALGISLSSLPN